MSWLARSIANSLKFEDNDDDDDGGKSESLRTGSAESKEDGNLSPNSPTRGVKEDLSELSRTLTRQFQGFASFLAPPPEQKSEPNFSGSDADPALGIRGDIAEIGGRFRSGITRLSNNINVSEITKMASSFLQLESNDEKMMGKGLSSRGGGAVGVTEEVVAFACDIASHPETWLDFPLPVNDGDEDDFDISDEQQEHALAVEQLVPRLAALRMELCPRYLTDDNFWKIYFVLVHTRLSKEDSLILSTPQVMEARALLAIESKTRKTAAQNESLTKKSMELEEGSTSLSAHPLSVPTPVSCETDLETSPDQNISSSPALLEKSETPDAIGVAAIVENNDSKDKGHEQKHNSSILVAREEMDDDDVDEWLKDEATETGGTSSLKSLPIHNDDDVDNVSFSDLEEEGEEGDARTGFRKSNNSSDKDTGDWVQLDKSSSASSKDTDTKLSDHDTKDWLDIA